MKVNIAEFEFDVSAIQKAEEENTRLKKSLIELKKEQKSVNDVIRRSGKVTEGQARYLASLDQKIKTNSASYRDNTKVIQANSASVSNVNKMLSEEVKSEAQATNSIRKLIQARKALDVTTKEGIKQRDKINEKIDQNNTFLDENSDKYTAQKRNIGNYGDSLKGLSPAFNKYISNLQGVRASMISYKSSIAGATKGTKLFKVALISTGIGAIVVAIGLLIGAFLKTQKGIDAVTRVLTPLKVVFQSLYGVLERLGAKMVDTFSNPKKAVSNLWESIKTNLVNRLDGLGEIFKSLGKIISSGFTDGYSDFANATLKVGTGVDDLIGKTKQATRDTGAFFGEAYQRGKKIADLNIDISKSEVGLSLMREKNLDIIKQQELISKDKNKTDAERNKALQIAIEKSKEIEKTENAILDLKIQKTKLEQSSNDTSREEEKALKELEAERERNKQKSRATELRFLGVRNQLASQARARAKKAAQDKLKDLEIELEKYKINNEVKLDEDKKLNQKYVDSKVEFFRVSNQMELSNLEYKKKKGLIKENEYSLAKLQLETDYQNNVKALRDEFKTQQEQTDFENRQAERDKKIKERQTEFELELEENKIKIQTKYEQKLSEEQIQYENDLAILEEKAVAEEMSLDEKNRRKAIIETEYQQTITKIKKDEAKKQERIQYIKESKKRKEASKTLGNIAELLGKETTAGKAAGIAQAMVNTWQGVTQVWSTKSSLPDPFSTISKIASTAVVVKSGLNAVSEIRKAEDGMLVGASHSQGGIPIEAEGGEAIINNRSMANPFLRNIASAINVAGGGVDFSTPNTTGYFRDGGVTSSSIKNSIPQTSLQDLKVVNVVEDTIGVYDEFVVQVDNLTSN